MRATAFLLLPFLAVSAAAQDRAAEIDFENELVQLRSSQMAVDPAVAKRANAVSQTLTAMADGPEISGQVAEYIRAMDVKVEFSAQPARSATKAGKITLSEKLPLYPRVLGPMLAREAALMMLSDMPDCAEKHYMRRSYEVRTWLDLGGDRKALPVMEELTGYKDEGLAADFKVWLDNGSELALEKIGQATKTEIIPALLDKAATPEEKAALEKANKRFVDFLINENDWRRYNGLGR